MKKQKKGPPQPKKPHPIREVSLLHQLLEVVAESIVRDRVAKGDSTTDQQRRR